MSGAGKVRRKSRVTEDPDELDLRPEVDTDLTAFLKPICKARELTCSARRPVHLLKRRYIVHH